MPIHPNGSISVNTISPLSNDDLKDIVEFRRRGMNDPRFEMAIHNELPRLIAAAEKIAKLESVSSSLPDDFAELLQALLKD